MAHRRIEEDIDRLNLLRTAPRGEALATLRKTLRDRVNLVVAKGAKMAAELGLSELLPDLLEAFDRLFDKAAERDPKCWGKNAIAKALVQLDHRDSPAFLRGARHVQMEAAYVRPEDTAVELRGICVLALISCTDLPRDEVMRRLVDGLTDPAHPVRMEAARGLEQMEGESAHLLRLKARLGDEESAVMGQVFDSLLRLEGARGVEFVAEFLPGESETAQEAALALGSSRIPVAVDLLLETWTRARSTEFRLAILRGLGISRQDRAIEFLEGLSSEGVGDVREAAREALALHRGTTETK